MDWFQPNKATRIRFRAMMESGQLVDEVADIVQTQVIAHKARASIRNRDAVPLYLQTEENRPPTWKENLLVETGMSPPPGTDTRYVMEDSLNLWKGFKTGAVETEAESKLRANLMPIVANTAAVVVFVGCLWFAGLGRGPEAKTIEEAAKEAVAELVPEEYAHGFVDQLEGQEGAGAGGPTGTGGETQDSGDDGGGPDDTVGAGRDGDTPEGAEGAP